VAGVTVWRVLLWVALPYAAAVSLVAGTVWRHRYDRFGWTTRSSQLYESRLLRLGSPVFHYGILFVFVGHLMGLFVPSAWTDAVGLDRDAYHWLSLVGGTIAGAAALAGIALLVWRRRTTGPVFLATTRNDKAMYVILVGAIVLGMTAKLSDTSAGGFDYRATIGPWLRSCFWFEPRWRLMTGVPVLYQVHVVAGLLLIAAVPWTRLVHILSAPVGYLFRPYLVYRSRPAGRVASGPPQRGWETPGL
jgi:nitrate reductase gamma subunit